MWLLTALVDVIFSIGLFINAVLFIPQAIKLYRTKDSKDLSEVTFIGFCLIQLSAVAYGLIHHDFILITGYTLSILTCGTVTYFILRYKSGNKAYSKEKFDLYFEETLRMLPGHVYWVDKQGILIGCNDTQAKDIGFNSWHELAGKSIQELYPKEIADLLIKNNNAIMENDIEQIIEEPHPSGDGRIHIYMSHKMPLRKNGEIIGIIGVSSDITQQKELEQKLNAAKLQAEALLEQNRNLMAHLSQEVTGQFEGNIDPEQYAKNMRDYYENIIALLPGHVYWLDSRGVYLGCNNQQAISAGLSSRKEIVGKTNAELPWNYHGETLPEALDKVNLEIMETGKPKTIEEPAILKDGTKAVFLSSKVPIRDKSGKVIGLLGISFDITAEKETEKLREQNLLNEEKLKTSKLMAASIAHELRTPLATISSIASNLYHYMPALFENYELNRSTDKLSTPMNDLELEYIKEAPSSLNKVVKTGNTFINMMLMKVNLEQIKAHKLTKLSMAKALNDSVALYPLEEDKRLLKIDISQDFEFMGDETLFRHIIFNLLKNAIYYLKAACKGHIEIWLEPGQEFNLLHFKDTGKGMSPEVLENLFGAFFSRTRNGTGVGLALCKLIMKEFNGDISCESVEGEFTHFIMKFPKIPKE